MIVDKTALLKTVGHQLNSFFIDNESIDDFFEEALDRVDKCFMATRNKYYHNQDEVQFSHLNSSQYSIFLYFLANTIHRRGGSKELSTKLYYLNKIMHSVDWYFEIELPEIWGVEHPVGSVLGRAKYSDGFFIYQGCTIGGNRGKYPTMGENVILFSNVTILGNSKVGRNVIFSSGTTVIDETIPDNSFVFGKSPNLIIKQKSEKRMLDEIGVFWMKKEAANG